MRCLPRCVPVHDHSFGGRRLGFQLSGLGDRASHEFASAFSISGLMTCSMLSGVTGPTSL
jgi:hypothetical protein